MDEITGNERIFFGTHKASGKNVYITKPKWDCGWYWSFGYLGNENWHYHLDGYKNGRNINMRDALITDYELSEKIMGQLWTFCELALSIYQLKATAELLGRGGSHMSKNPCADLILDKDYAKKNK